MCCNVIGQGRESGKQIINSLVLPYTAEEEESTRSSTGAGGAQQFGGQCRADRAMPDDGTPARHSTECGELIQRRLRVGQHEVTGLDQGAPRGYVVREDRLVRQHVMRGPHEMHANHPAGPQPDKEPDLRQPVA